MAEIRITRARPADALKIRNMHVASIRTLCARDYTPRQIEAWAGPKKPAHYRRSMAAGEIMFVARLGPRILGFSGTQGGEIRALYMHPRFLRRGIATRLLAAVEDAARRAGHASVWLNSTLTAQDFYRSRGYRTIRRTTHTLRSNGVKIPCFLMRKRVGPPAWGPPRR